MTDYQPIEIAPYNEVVWVKNDIMSDPVKATRGFVLPNGSVHENQTYFTSVHTEFCDGCSFKAGELVCPNEWKPCSEGEAN